MADGFKALAFRPPVSKAQPVVVPVDPLKPSPVLHTSVVTGRRRIATPMITTPALPRANLGFMREAPVEKLARTWVSKGQSRDLVILDREMGPTVVEHHWASSTTKRYDQYERCAQKVGNCPLCEESAIYGVGRASRKLTCVSVDRGMMEKDPRSMFSIGSLGLYNQILRAADEFGSLAGLQVRLTRHQDDPSPTGRMGIVGIVKLSDIRHSEVYDYAALLPPATAAGLRAYYGGVAPVGSSDDVLSELTEGEGSVL